MKERPILFSAPMVRAILDNRKTMTRRVVNPQPERCENPGETPRLRWCPKGAKYNAQLDGWIPSFVWNANLGPAETGAASITDHCPYGKPGDRLWVRETWQAIHVSVDPETGYGDDVSESHHIPKDNEGGWWGIAYAATDPAANDAPEDRWFAWRPSIHMPRWASRITLEITDVRIERLQQIKESDAQAEGLIVDRYTSGHEPGTYQTAKIAFERLWDKLNLDRGFSWESNPFVWVVSFKRI